MFKDFGLLLLFTFSFVILGAPLTSEASSVSSLACLTQLFQAAVQSNDALLPSGNLSYVRDVQQALAHRQVASASIPLNDVYAPETARAAALEILQGVRDFYSPQVNNVRFNFLLNGLPNLSTDPKVLSLPAYQKSRALFSAVADLFFKRANAALADFPRHQLSAANVIKGSLRIQCPGSVGVGWHRDGLAATIPLFGTGTWHLKDGDSREGLDHPGEVEAGDFADAPQGFGFLNYNRIHSVPEVRDMRILVVLIMSHDVNHAANEHVDMSRLRDPMVLGLSAE